MASKVEKVHVGETFTFSNKNFESTIVTMDGVDYAYNRWEKSPPLNEGDFIVFELGDKNKAGLIKLMKVKKVDGENGVAPEQAKPKGATGNYWNSDEKIEIDKSRLRWEMTLKQWGISRAVALEKAISYFDLHKTKKPEVEEVLEVAGKFAQFLMTDTTKAAADKAKAIAAAKVDAVVVPPAPKPAPPPAPEPEPEYDFSLGDNHYVGTDDDLPF